MYVKITKLESLMFTDSNVTDGYWVEGELLREVRVGKPVVLDRRVRNGVVVPGLFKTSPVVAVTETGFRTENSVYEMESVEQ